MNAHSPLKTPLPDWLAPAVKPARTLPATKAELHQRFEHLFEKAIDALCAGDTLRSIMEADIRIDDGDDRSFSYFKGAFLRWIERDPDRWQEYLRAKRIGAEYRAEQIVERADKLTEFSSMEDMRRVEVQGKLDQWYASVNSRERFGAQQQININQDINLTGILEAAQGRVDQMRQIEGETLSIDRGTTLEE